MAEKGKIMNRTPRAQMGARRFLYVVDRSYPFSRSIIHRFTAIMAAAKTISAA